MWRIRSYPVILAALFLTAPLCVAAPVSPETIELPSGWRMASAWDVVQDGAAISQSSYDAGHWHPIARMPVTILEALQEDGTYPNLYYGKNLTETTPKDLFRQDWWYRTTFTVPPGHKLQWLVFKGINYRAEVWLNGVRVADNRQVVGMYNEFELNVTGKVSLGSENVLAVRVTPEQAFEDVDGVNSPTPGMTGSTPSTWESNSPISRLVFPMCPIETAASGSRFICGRPMK